jgi:hypothetical protein
VAFLYCSGTLGAMLRVGYVSTRRKSWCARREPARPLGLIGVADIKPVAVIRAATAERHSQSRYRKVTCGLGCRTSEEDPPLSYARP